MPIESLGDGGFVATGNAILFMRLKVIEKGLKFEVEHPGMSMTSKANVAQVARVTLQNAGRPAARSKAKLLQQFSAYVAELSPDEPSITTTLPNA